MSVQESSVAAIVSQASARMHDPKYISSEVDQFIGLQPAVAQLVMAHSSELTVEGVVTVLFHAALLARSIEQESGSLPPAVSFGDLDHATTVTADVEALAEIEPQLASYIASNVERTGTLEAKQVQTLLAQITRALLG